MARVALILDARPALESRLHDLVWREAGGDVAAGHEVAALWEKEAPEDAARLAALTAKVRAQVDDLKAQGKI